MKLCSRLIYSKISLNDLSVVISVGNECIYILFENFYSLKYPFFKETKFTTFMQVLNLNLINFGNILNKTGIQNIKFIMVSISVIFYNLIKIV